MRQKQGKKENQIRLKQQTKQKCKIRIEQLDKWRRRRFAFLRGGRGVLRHVQGTHAVGQWQGACMGQVTGMCVHMCKLNVTTHTHTHAQTLYTTTIGGMARQTGRMIYLSVH